MCKELEMAARMQVWCVLSQAGSRSTVAEGNPVSRPQALSDAFLFFLTRMSHSTDMLKFRINAAVRAAAAPSSPQSLLAT